MTHLTLERLADGRQYHFRPAGTRNGRPIYRDAKARDLVIFWDPQRGWAFRDPARGALVGAGGTADLPPEGLWTGSGPSQVTLYRLMRRG
ncbi:hypothetical protein [Salibaculum sp.]|jgi:hypothetical protein|uniref:hypothetical protein n=1 Tax=Salibaculum sp. TaxID=2855480 RepID=UPI002B478B88|nr:hypothetical protein [Salibaculum sp.]HKL68787.1 hypothetical protein [Salibaculum sp.]